MRKLCLVAFFAFFVFVLVACSNENEDSKIIQEPTETAVPVQETDVSSSVTPVEEEDMSALEEEAAYVIPVLEGQPLDVPNTEAFQFTKQLQLGFNLGNTFDAVVADGVTYEGDPLNIESSWVGIKTTADMIQTLKDTGFGTLRIPVSWHDHVDENYTIDAAWLNRVQEVVNYAYDIDMNIIINIHHDNELSFLYPTYELQEQSTRYVKTIWSQLSEHFKDYDERLVFEAMNEPRLKGTSQEWWIDVNSPSSTEPLDVINALNQTFVDTVRKSGGQNATRYLMVPSYAASPDFTQTDKFKLPTDTVDNKLILSVHSYSPYHFALAGPEDSNSITTFNHTASYSTKDIDYFLNNVYEKYVSNGIPVVVGEFGSRDKGGNTQDRINHAAYFAHTASSRGIPVVWWDNHHFEGDGERFGLLDRYSNSWRYPEIVEALTSHSLK